jgi:hypothetical protein
MNDQPFYPQRVTISFDLPFGLGTDTIAVQALLNLLDHLEHDGIRPHATTLKIDKTTP